MAADPVEGIPVLVGAAPHRVEDAVGSRGTRGALFGNEMDPIRCLGSEPPRVLDVVRLHAQDEIGGAEHRDAERRGAVIGKVHLVVGAHFSAFVF